MKTQTMTAAILISALLFSFKTVTPGSWTADRNHAKVGFTISHNMTSDVEGSFKSFEATITAPGEDFAGATFDFSADAASISTDNAARDKNIKGSDFLDVEKFPKVVFKSTSVIKKNASVYRIKGDLTLHGITKSITLVALVRIPPAALGLTKTIAGFKVSGTIRRGDFNIGAGFADMMLGDEITLNVNGEFAKN